MTFMQTAGRRGGAARSAPARALGRPGGDLRPRRQVRQVVQRSRLQRRRALQGRGDRRSTFAEFELQSDAQREQALRRFAEQGNNPIIMAGFSQRHAAGDGRAGIPRHQVRPDRRRGRPAQRALGRVQRARGLLPRRHAGGDGLEDRQGRLRRRHGHPADPQVRLRLRPGRQGGEPRRQGHPEHDRHHPRRLERPGQGRRAAPSARSTRAPTWSTPPPAAPASACCRPPRTPASSAIGVDSNQNYLHPGQVLTSMLKRVDVADLRRLDGRAERHVDGRRPGAGPRRGRRRLRARREQRGADHRRDEGRGRRGQGQDHLRRDQGARLHAPTRPARSS